MPEQYVGVVANPEADFPDQGKLTFQPLRLLFPPEDKAGFQDPVHALQGIVLVLAFDGPTEVLVEGSAVMVAAGVAICAAHVVLHRREELSSQKWRAFAYAMVNGELQIWNVRTLTTVPGSDLAILGMELRSAVSPGQTLHFAAITTRLPQLQEHLTVVGTIALAERFLKEEGKESPQVDLSVVVSTGKVQERYPGGRDRFLMPWPCLQVGCQSAGGMSGGPVFDSHGYLVGILSSSVDDGQKRPEPSFISLLVPALVHPFSGGWPPGTFQEPRRLIECPMNSIDRRDVITNEVIDGAPHYKYTAWE